MVLIRQFLAVTLIGTAALLVPAASTAGHADVTFVQVLRVTQQPYQPLAIRIWVKAPVGHQIFAGYKIFDSAGHGVYSPRGSGVNGTASYAQPYASSSLTLHWNKIAYDGSRLPRGRRFYVIAYASDTDTNQKLRASKAFAFTLTT